MVGTARCPCSLCVADPNHSEARHHTHLRAMLERLDEQQQRLFAGLEALRLGRGGIRLLSEVTSMSRATVRRGRNEVLAGFTTLPTARIRRPGAGRPRAEKKVLVSFGA